MTTFVRGELAICKLRFRAADGSTDQPTAMELYLEYTNTSNNAANATISLTRDTTTNIWSASWNTALAKANTRVYWVARSTSGLQGADEGDFFVRGNQAND